MKQIDIFDLMNEISDKKQQENKNIIKSKELELIIKDNPDAELMVVHEGNKVSSVDKKINITVEWLTCYKGKCLNKDELRTIIKKYLVNTSNKNINELIENEMIKYPFKKFIVLF